MEEATLTQEQLDRQRKIFMANGGTIEFVEVRSSAEVIKGLKPKFQKKTIETWVSGDINRLKKGKKDESNES